MTQGIEPQSGDSLIECPQCHGDGEYFTDGECHDCFVCKPRERMTTKPPTPPQGIEGLLSKLEAAAFDDVESAENRKIINLEDAIVLVKAYHAKQAAEPARCEIRDNDIELEVAIAIAVSKGRPPTIDGLVEPITKSVMLAIRPYLRTTEPVSVSLDDVTVAHCILHAARI